MDKTKEYFIGIDAGTDSVGYAVTDTQYNLLKFNGKTMWGSHLFEAANTAESRRMSRAARRRLDREKQRIGWTQQIFAVAIDEVDPLFFIRLNDSFYKIEDRDLKQMNILFDDADFKDKDFYKKFPTIYHLRNALMTSDDADDFDSRFVYLAVAHIMRHRGHFLFPGENLAAIASIKDTLGTLDLLFYDTLGIVSGLARNAAAIETALKAQKGFDKRRLLEEAIVIDDGEMDPKTLAGFKTMVIKMLVGNKVSLAKLFENDEYADLPAVQFSKGSFEDSDLPQIMDALGDDEATIILSLKAIYDWSLLSMILDGCPTVSEAKVKRFARNGQQLRQLKKVISKYAPAEYEAFFHGAGKDNYVAYTGKDHDERLKRKNKSLRIRRCSTEDFYGRIRKILSKAPAEDPDVAEILAELEDKSFLPLLQSFRNGVIPNQLVKAELEAILGNASRHLPFLLEKDSEGFTPVDKLLSLVSFCVPYYVGPLGHNPADKNTWAVHLEEGSVLPWKFSEMIDLEASEERFIRRMTSKCTYLKDQDVLPKNSLLYSKYMVLNELNNLRINGELLTVTQKQEIYNGLFLRKKKVSQSALKKFVIANSWYRKGDVLEISGIDGDFKASLSSWIDFASFMADGRLSIQDVEEIIKWLTLFSDGGDVVRRRIGKAFGDKLTAEEISRISRFKYSGWGRLSAKFLDGILATDHETGEMKTIIQLMWTTQYNLMQLLSKDYEFINQVSDSERIERISYSALDDLYVSPSVKRQIWQTLKIVDEIIRIMGHRPAKLFLEVARGGDESEKGRRTVSRKDSLLAAMKSGKLNEDDKELVLSLEGTEGSLVAKRDRLYLYYSQMGKCMYSGQPINIEDLDNHNLYDIDHIYPFSKSNDDSLSNKVLVCSSLNREKSATYPISDDIRKRMTPFWKLLRDKGLINGEKYNRLTRSSPLSDSDLEGFINRQLVETRQSTKATATILKRFLGDDTKVVYSKARPVADFRDQFDFVKSRSVNSLHHGKDAYLNIVVGNILDAKYTSMFYRAKDYGREYYNLSKPFVSDVKGAWSISDGTSIETVRRMMKRNDVILTRQPVSRNGQLFDLQLLKAGEEKGMLPARPSDEKLRRKLADGSDKASVYKEWTEKYGGYTKMTISHFALVSYSERKKKYVAFIPIRVLDRDRTRTESDLIDYCMNELHLKNVTVIRFKVLINSLLEVDGYRVFISGKTDNSFLLKNGISLVLDDESTKYVKRLEKFNERLRADRSYVLNEKYDRLSREENERLYRILVDKASNGIFSKRPNCKAQALSASFEKFHNLDILDQIRMITSLLTYFGLGTPSDFSYIGEGPKTGVMKLPMRTQVGSKSLALIDQSVTGLFESRTVLS